MSRVRFLFVLVGQFFFPKELTHTLTTQLLNLYILFQKDVNHKKLANEHLFVGLFGV